jgi:hypothetical protein
VWPLGGSFSTRRQISGYDGLHRILLFSTNLSFTPNSCEGALQSTIQSANRRIACQKALGRAQQKAAWWRDTPSGAVGRGSPKGTIGRTKRAVTWRTAFTSPCGEKSSTLCASIA